MAIAAAAAAAAVKNKKQIRPSEICPRPIYMLLSLGHFYFVCSGNPIDD
jgi:hypothetical protein